MKVILFFYWFFDYCPFLALLRVDFFIIFITILIARVHLLFLSVGCWASLVIPHTVVSITREASAWLAEVTVCCKILHSFVTPGTGVLMRGVGKSTM